MGNEYTVAACSIKTRQAIESKSDKVCFLALGRNMKEDQKKPV